MTGRAQGNQDAELKGRIFNIQKYSIYDGDGIRTLIFFKGCNLRCDWCANPEGLSSQFQVMVSHDKCVQCGKCADVCPAGCTTCAPRLRGIECITWIAVWIAPAAANVKPSVWAMRWMSWGKMSRWQS